MRKSEHLGAVSLKKSHDIVISSFCNIVKGQAIYMVLYIATTRNLEMQKRPINCMGEKRIPNLIKLHISNNLKILFHFYNFSVDDLDVMFVNRLLYLEDKRHILNVSNTELDLADQDYRFEDVIKDDKTLDMLEDAFNQISLWAKNRRIVQKIEGGGAKFVNFFF